MFNIIDINIVIIINAIYYLVLYNYLPKNENCAVQWWYICVLSITPHWTILSFRLLYNKKLNSNNYNNDNGEGGIVSGKKGNGF